MIAFFLAEMGDKTQIATVALAARFDSLVGVVMGTTAGMMMPQCLLCCWAKPLPNAFREEMGGRHCAAPLFAVLGVVVLSGCNWFYAGYSNLHNVLGVVA